MGQYFNRRAARNSFPLAGRAVKSVINQPEEQLKGTNGKKAHARHRIDQQTGKLTRFLPPFHLNRMPGTHFTDAHSSSS